MPAYIWTLALLATLLPIAWIDARRQIIPDSLNLLLAILGVVHVIIETGLATLSLRLLAAAAVAIFFLGLRKLYFVLRSRTGLGLGDVKFLTAATLWLGPLGLPWLVLFASISGLAWHIAVTYRGGGASPLQRIAFGPHLAVGFLAAWIWQPQNMI
ncbi:prepilin peptidase [Taklimakanibacter lacteus]|uniref:prepilin peptidase n=1 Tax=Taklimakanibacter lacteus TaxID=2268456 RepID=UPI0013C49B22